MNKPTVSKSKIEQTIDLSEFTDVDLSDARSLKEQIGQALIDVIHTRTESGLGFNSVKLKSPYSKDYVKSLEFKAAGKGPSDVNMSLTGDMLSSVDVDARDEGIKIYVGDDQVLKAFNHITGDTVPKRNWFGLSKKEVQSVVDDFKDDIAQFKTDEQSPDGTDTLDQIRQTFRPFGSDDDSED